MTIEIIYVENVDRTCLLSDGTFLTMFETNSHQKDVSHGCFVYRCVNHPSFWNFTLFSFVSLPSFRFVVCRAVLSLVLRDGPFTRAVITILARELSDVLRYIHINAITVCAVPHCGAPCFISQDKRHTRSYESTCGGKRRISFTLSFIPTSIFMAHFACSGGCYGPAELDPGILFSLHSPPPFSTGSSLCFFPLHDTRCKWALGGSESVALNVDFCGTGGSLSPKLMKQIYDGCWAQQIKLTVMYGGLMPPWSLHSTTGRSLPG